MCLNSYMVYMKDECKSSENTLEAYRRDIQAFEKYILSKSIPNLIKVTDADVVGYILKLKEEERSSATINRKVASLRGFYNFLIEEKRIQHNPVKRISLPKTEKKEVEYLTIEEIERLLSVTEDTVAGKRDKAILEMMYATGMRVSEAIELQTNDVNTSLGFVSFDGTHGRARIVPLGKPAKVAAEEYLNSCREKMLKGKEDQGFFFVNYCGDSLTRQGVWKIIKKYGAKAGLEDKISPHVIRNSFAAHMVENGIDLKSLQELMGHEDISATQIYMTVKKSKIKEAYDMTHPRA